MTFAHRFRQTLNLAAREIRERRLVFPVAAILGVAVPPLASTLRLELIVVALAVGLGLGHGVALLVGATMINRPLREGRLSFFFNRPVSPGVIWWGKLSGAVALAAAVQAIVVLPGYLWGRFTGVDVGDGLSLLLASTCGLLGSTLVGHAFATMVSSRSKLSLVDFVAFCIAVLLVWVSIARLRDVFAESALVWLAVLLALSGTVGALLGGWRQVRVGRVDPARSHRALSVTLWPATLLAAGVGFGFSGWVLHADPGSMMMLRLTAASDSPWFVATHMRYLEETHPQSKLQAQILSHAETGEWHVLEGDLAGPLPARLSRRGEQVVWTTWSRREPHHQAWLADITSEGLGTRRELLVPGTDLATLAAWELSPRGDRIVDLQFSEVPSRPSELSVRIRVWETATGRPVAEDWLELPLIRSGWRPWSRLFWDEGGRIRLFLDTNSHLAAWVKDTAESPLQEAGRVDIGRAGPDLERPSGPVHLGLVSEPWVSAGTAVRFSSGGETVLVGFFEEPREGEEGLVLGPRRDPEDGGNVSLPSSEAQERDARTLLSVDLDRMGFALYDATLSQEIWRLPTLTARVTQLDLQAGRAIVSSWGGAGVGMRMLVGDAEGWSQPFERVWWSTLGWIEEGKTLGVMTRGGATEILDVRTGEIRPLPEALREQLRGRHGIHDVDVFSSPSGFDGGEIVHSSTRGLYSIFGHLTKPPSIVRADFDSARVEPLYE